MIKTLLHTIIAFTFIVGTGSAFSAQPDIAPGLLEEAQSSFIFVFTSDVNERDIPGLAKGLARQAGGSVRNVYKKVIRGFSANMSATAAAKLAASNSNIAYYVQNGVAGIPPNRATEGKKPDSPPGQDKPPSEPPPSSQITPWGVDRVGGPGDGSGSNACTIDSGVDLSNDDLNIDLVHGANFIGQADGSGRKGSDIQDKNGHGTHVAGILAAKDNDIGVVGVAAGAAIIPLRVFGASGQGFIDDIIEALEYIADNELPCDVVNMSLEAYGQFPLLTEAVETVANSGYKFAICAGNNSDYAGDYDPARAVGTNIYTVAAMDKNDVFADFSNYGNPPIDYVAPGVDVESYVLNGVIQSWEGCSMATPHVAGILLSGGINDDGSITYKAPDGGEDFYPIAHF